MKDSKVIEVTQKPIIVYSLLEKISKEVQKKITSLDIDTLEPTDENLSVIKSTRADLNKDFKELEEQRKMVKEIVLKDYNLFEEAYKKLISAPFKDADVKLKSLADTVDDEILSLKINGLKNYFTEANTFDFISFEDLGLKIIKSKSDKVIKSEIDEYLADVKASIETIKTLQNSDRVLAKFQICKDLSRSISDVNIEVQREEHIKAQNEERERIAAERKQQEEDRKKEREMCPDNASVDEVVEQAKRVEQPQTDDTVYQATFTAFATKAQLGELKKFMIEKGIKYESK